MRRGLVARPYNCPTESATGECSKLPSPSVSTPATSQPGSHQSLAAVEGWPGHQHPGAVAPPAHHDADGHSAATRGGAVRRRPPARRPLRRALLPLGLPLPDLRRRLLPGAPRVTPLPLRGLRLPAHLVRRRLDALLPRRRRPRAVRGRGGRPGALPVAPQRRQRRAGARQRGLRRRLQRPARQLAAPVRGEDLNRSLLR